MMIDLLGQTFAGVRAFFEVFFSLLYALSERPKKKERDLQLSALFVLSSRL